MIVALLAVGSVISTTAAALPALLQLRGGGGASAPEQPKTGKVWTTSTFTRDHVRFMVELPHYLGAYLGPRALPPSTIESIMITVNSINTCPYCTGLHGQLARMANVDAVDKSSPAVQFATTFAMEAGRGAKVVAAFKKLTATIGNGQALSVRALCWALLWGKTTGNSINMVRAKLVSLKWWKLTPFELIEFVYYAPLFLIIGILNAALVKAPPTPAWFGSLFGAILWLPQALHLSVMGLLCLVLRVLAAPFGGLSL